MSACGEECDAAFGPDASQYGPDPTTYRMLRSNPVGTLDGDTDLVGDGTVVLARAPGHTPVRQALFVRLPKTGRILLSGDAAYLADN